MKLSVVKSLSLGLLTTCMTLSVTHAAKSSDENIEVTPTQEVTQQELAAIYVFSEICPKLIKDDGQFQTGYAKLAHEYLPQEQNAVTALKKITQQKNFKSILAEARSDAKKAGDSKNLQICQDVSTYGN
ncbi:MAG: hypothetical protein PHW49_08310 [Acinetobacter harbinensis]|uniref:MCR_0457 family protein n=1 Tax=Acinetobacter TaxID=469 RepID=UPI00057FB3B9|nr:MULTISPECIES: hypothetical protein [Acinetobacter]KWQ05523.1 hypothetical protein SE27_09850 [Acinetobacter harbinensis]MBR5556757.1 hypothetical protein [Acinetobacter sp.]MDD2940712.1 hypothetical protein [Acinetobacter harbinensis]